MKPSEVTAAGATMAAGSRHRQDWLRFLPSLGIGALLAYLVLLPLALVVLSSFRPGGFPLDSGFTLNNYVTAYGDPYFLTLLGNTLMFGLGASAFALTMGISLAWLVERSDLPGRELLRGLVLLPMATPPILLAIAWAMLLSPRNGVLNLAMINAFGLGGAPLNIYTLPGMVFVQGLALVPTAYLFLSPAFANMDPNLEEAALASGAGTWALIRRVMLPLLWPPILSAAIFLVIVSLVVFDVPGTLGTPARVFVLSSQIYYLIANAPGGIPLYGQVSALAMLFLLVLLGLGFAYHRLTRQAQRYRTITGKGFRPRIFPLGRGRPWALAAIVLYFLLSVVAPLLILLWMSLMPYQTGISWAAFKLLTLENHIDFLQNTRMLTATRNSLTIAVVAATCVALLALVISWFTVRLRVPGRQALDVLAFIPIAVPGVMMGVALVYVYITLGAALPIYGTIWIIAIAYITQYLPFGSRAMSGVMMQLHPELEEVGSTSGAGKLRILRRITFPLIWPAFAAIWIWVLAHALRELSSALLLQGRNNSVIPTLLWDYWSGGEPNRTAAGGLWLTIALVLFLVVWRAVSRRSGLERMR